MKWDGLKVDFWWLIIVAFVKPYIQLKYSTWSSQSDFAMELRTTTL